jgi:hypothetical protein
MLQTIRHPGHPLPGTEQHVEGAIPEEPFILLSADEFNADEQMRTCAIALEIQLAE